MSAEQRLRAPRHPVEPLDDASRALVPKTRVHEEPRTAQRDEEVPSTEPDGATQEQLARIRDSVLSGLQMVEEARARTPRDVSLPSAVALCRMDEPPTIPARDPPSSDVFAPMALNDRAVLLDPEGPTPLDRPVTRLPHDRPTDVDALRHAPTVTNQVARATPVQRDDPSDRPDPRERETDRERKLMMSVYDSERAFLVVKDHSPERAAHVESLKRHLAASGRLDDRELVLAQHAREKVALANAPAREHEERADRVMALALHAHDLDDRWRAQVVAHREQLIDDLGTLPDDKRAAVFADFETFAERDGANDSYFCRREMHKALKQEQELHKAYVYALALDKQKVRQSVDAQAATKVASDDSTGSRRRR